MARALLRRTARSDFAMTLKRWPLATLVLAGAAACAAESPTAGIFETTWLVTRHPTEQMIRSGESRTLEVSYLDAVGTPLAGVVYFSPRGFMNRAYVSHDWVRTEADGLARVRVEAGGPASFELWATAEGALPLVFTIRVADQAVGVLDVETRYEGRTTVAWVDLSLVPNRTCGELADGHHPEPMDQAGMGPWDTHRFEGVPVGMLFAVEAVGVDRAGVAVAEGCSAGRLESDRGSVTVELEERVPKIDGLYDLDVEADLRTYPITGFADTLGTDARSPGSWLVTVAATDPNTEDLHAILADRATRAATADALHRALFEVHGANDMGQIMSLSEDLNDAFSAVTLHGTMRLTGSLGDPDLEGALTIDGLSVTLRGRTTTHPYFAPSAALSGVTEGRALHIATDDMSVPLGTLVRAVVEHTVLPALPGRPENVRDFVRGLFDCGALVPALERQRSYPADLAIEVCLEATMPAIWELEKAVDVLSDWPWMALEGSTGTEDQDVDGIVDRLNPGAGTLSWDHDATPAEAEATVSGRRLSSFVQDDAVPYDVPL